MLICTGFSQGLSLHSFAAGSRRGLVLGYGALPEPSIEHAVRLLAEAFAQLEGHRPAARLATG